MAQGETLDALKRNAVDAILAWRETQSEITREKGGDTRATARRIITMSLLVESPFHDDIPDGGLVPAS